VVFSLNPEYIETFQVGENQIGPNLLANVGIDLPYAPFSQWSSEDIALLAQ
jgi:hypothetical protein